MYVIKAVVCFAAFTLVSSRGTPPRFTFPQGNKWTPPIDYIRIPESKNISCQADAIPPAKYYWTFNGKNITWGKNVITFNENNGNLTTGPDFKMKHSGEYQCIAYNAHGTLMTPLHKLMAAVHGSFVGNVKQTTLTVFESKYIKLECKDVTENVPPPEFIWFKGKSDDPGEFKRIDLEERMMIDHEGSLHFLWATLNDTYSYTCATYNSVFLSTKRNPGIIKLQVNAGSKTDRDPNLKYPVLENQRNLEVYAGEDAVLMCIFTYFSRNVMEVTWSKRGEKVHTGPTYILKNVQLPDTQDLEGEYLCEARLGSNPVFGRVSLKIVGAPTFIPGQDPKTKYVPVEKDVVIECKTTSHNSYSFPPVWFKNGKPIIGCPKFYFACRNRRTDGYSHCISDDNVCNNVPECHDHSDEQNCLGSCIESQKRCGERCISESETCSEDPCTYPAFMCHNKRGCPEEEKICDGTSDCIDGSDELACPGGAPAHVDGVNINSARTQLTVPNIGLEDTMCFQCMVRNEYGSVFGDACLTVIDKIWVLKQPNSSYFVEPGSRLEIIVEATTDQMWQQQMNYTWLWYEEVTDKKTDTVSKVAVTLPPGGRARNFFRVTHKGQNMTIMFPEMKKTGNDDDYAVYEQLINRPYTLVIQHPYDRVELNFTINGKSIVKPAPVVKAAATNLWFIAVILAILLLFVVVALVVCFMYRNRGGTYLVDEKEKKAGNDPEQELKDGGLHDVGRVEDYEDDPDKPKGDKASLSESVKPYESDDDLTEEYGGDFDASKFNEDGSFIGVYIEKRGDPREVTV